MYKSKIPLPSKCSSASSIPVPVRSNNGAVKKKIKSQIQLPSSSQESLSSEVKQSLKGTTSVPTHSSVSTNFRRESKSLVHSKSYPARKAVYIPNKPKPEKKQEKKVQAAPLKPVKRPVKSAPAKIVKRIQPSARICNQKEKFKKEPRPIPKIQLAPQEPGELVKKSELSEIIHNIAVKGNDEQVAVVPVKEKETESNLDDDDSEFKASGFYKNLILSERELSPGLMRLCADAKFSSIATIDKTPAKNHSSVHNFVEDVKRNSAKFLKIKSRLMFSPHPTCKNSPFKACDIFSNKENLDTKLAAEMRRMSEMRKKTLEKSDSRQDSFNSTFRRWTCNIQNNSDIASMSTMQIAAEIRRLSEMRRDSVYRMQNKLTNSAVKHQKENLSSHQSAVKETEALLSKKKEKPKKKVTFNIPPSSPPDLAPAPKESKNTNHKSHLTDIVEVSSENSTPEFSTNIYNSEKNNVLSKDSAKNCEDSSQSATPELNLNTLRIDSNLFSKGDVEIKSQATESQSATPEFDLEILDTCDELLSKDSKFSSNFSHPTLFTSNIPSIEIDRSNANPNQLSLCEGTPTERTCSESSVPKDATSLIQSLERLAVIHRSPPSNKMKNFRINSARTIFTPRPVSLHPNSRVTNYMDESFLTDNSPALSSLAPICTPFVLKSLANNSEDNLSSIRQRLNFNEEPKLSNERRESQIVLKSIPTLQKMFDYLCDQECCILSLQSSSTEPLNRNLKNPIATILSNGDEMHFVPVS